PQLPKAIQPRDARLPRDRNRLVTEGNDRVEFALFPAALRETPFEISRRYSDDCRGVPTGKGDFMFEAEEGEAQQRPCKPGEETAEEVGPQIADREDGGDTPFPSHGYRGMRGFGCRYVGEDDVRPLRRPLG